MENKVTLKEYLKALNPPAQSIDVESDDELEDYIYSDEFIEDLDSVKNRRYLSFKTKHKQPPEDMKAIDVCLIAKEKGWSGHSLYIEVPYKNKEDDDYIFEMIDILNNIGVSMTIIPEENVNIEDFITLLKKVKEKYLNDNNIKILIYPIIDLIQYKMKQIVVDKFIDKERTSGETIDKLLKPEPSEYVKRTFVRQFSESDIEKIKGEILNSFTDSEIEKLENLAGSFLYTLKKELEEHPERYGLSIIK